MATKVTLTAAALAAAAALGLRYGANAANCSWAGRYHRTSLSPVNATQGDGNRRSRRSLSTGRTACRGGSGGDCQKRSMSEAAFSSPSTAPDRDGRYCGRWPPPLRPLIDHRTVLEPVQLA